MFNGKKVREFDDILNGKRQFFVENDCFGWKRRGGLVKKVADLEAEVEKLKAIVAEVTNTVYSEEKK